MILDTEIFAQENMSHPLVLSAFTELIICLNDLLQKCRKADVPVRFDVDVDPTADLDSITNLVNRIRNAVCHITNETHQVENSEMIFSFNVIYGEGALAQFGAYVFRSDYADDICFFWHKSHLSEASHHSEHLRKQNTNCSAIAKVHFYATQ
ncbi:MAG: hypothetical protein IPK17_37685 [Chloroflexi bacterium]|uniref:hypothetical protein n=1 Tax=Candidatus Flexifilum breve TaxID=3140694 RepID=UPI003136EE0C|nr:hypothetical protein [Chloroflexota bacterium]